MKPGQFNKATPKFMGFKFELQRTSIANHLSMQKKNPVLAPLTRARYYGSGKLESAVRVLGCSW